MKRRQVAKEERNECWHVGLKSCVEHKKQNCGKLHHKYHSPSLHKISCFVCKSQQRWQRQQQKRQQQKPPPIVSTMYSTAAPPPSSTKTTKYYHFSMWHIKFSRIMKMRERNTNYYICISTTFGHIYVYNDFPIPFPFPFQYPPNRTARHIHQVHN